jgi:rsbT antagonist protein RsbS
MAGPSHTRPAEPPRVSILSQGDCLIASVHTALDDSQLMQFQHDLIERIRRDRARGVIIDVAALDVVDSFGSRTLRNLAAMAQLQGAQTVVVGINPELAITMVQLGLRLESVHTALGLEEGLTKLEGLIRGDGSASSLLASPSWIPPPSGVAGASGPGTPGLSGASDPSGPARGGR